MHLDLILTPIPDRWSYTSSLQRPSAPLRLEGCAGGREDEIWGSVQWGRGDSVRWCVCDGKYRFDVKGKREHECEREGVRGRGSMRVSYKIIVRGRGRVSV